ncbi:hypothetical protein [Chondrinema litorale]|uniref:hypothetical protein n=1 Tax=Chondrinema litorale TaxID=2994555 RepID=UPI002543F198|nr:hypothetical protein [Chondrinema litorale]UZR95296.1 hypothetical protein OQ292_05615 [Chondrinema litorale]
MDQTNLATYLSIALPILVMLLVSIIQKPIRFKLVIPFVIIVVAWFFGIRVLNKFIEFLILYSSITIVLVYLIKRPVDSHKIAKLSTVLVMWAIVIIVFLGIFSIKPIRLIIVVLAYPGFIGALIFFYKRIPKLKNAIIAIVILAHTSLSIFIGIGSWSGYFSEQTIKPLSKNNFIIFKTNGAFLHSYLSCTLAKNFFGKYIYFEVDTIAFNSGKIEDAIIKEDDENQQIRVTVDEKTEVLQW